MRQDPKYFMLLNKVEVTLEFVESLPVHLCMSQLEEGIWKRKFKKTVQQDIDISMLQYLLFPIFIFSIQKYSKSQDECQ